jgi:hypothetical protein
MYINDPGRRMTMLEFVVTHKYCGMTKTIQGYNVWDALKANNLDYNVWTVVSVQNI